MLSATIRMPELALVITNPEETVSAMTTAVEAKVVARTLRGEGAEGPLPSPKDAGTPRNPGGRALQRTGHMVAAIGSALRPGKGGGALPSGVVRPFGSRPAHEAPKIARAKEAAKRRTAKLRTEAIEKARWDEIHGVEPALKKRGGKCSAGRIRVRTVIDNASLAGILSQPPKDPRGIAGNRARYRVFEVKPEEEREAQAAAQRTMRAELVEVGAREVKL